MMKRVNFTISEVEIKRLKLFKEKMGLSASEILRRALDEYWGNHTSEEVQKTFDKRWGKYKSKKGR